jgi:hypothetical protein
MTTQQLFERVKHWGHDTLLVLGAVSVFTLCGGWSTFGYYFDFSFIPIQHLDRVAKK